jgi:hypothetical protein
MRAACRKAYHGKQIGPNLPPLLEFARKVAQVPTTWLVRERRDCSDEAKRKRCFFSTC